MPIDYSLYPINWKTEIRPAIIRRAGNRCEKCGVNNHEKGARDIAGRFWNEIEIAAMPVILLNDRFKICEYKKIKIFKIVLTIAHADHDINNNNYTDNAEDPENNLFAWCQKCHLDHDRDQHTRTRRENKNQRTGQQELF